MGYFILTYSMVEVYFADSLNRYAISGGNPISVLKKQAILYMVIPPWNLWNYQLPSGKTLMHR